MWLGPRLSVRLRKVSVSGGSTVAVNADEKSTFRARLRGEGEGAERGSLSTRTKRGLEWVTVSSLEVPLKNVRGG